MDGSVAPLFFLAAIAGAFWLLVLRPAKARAKAQAETVKALNPGDRILMASGMVGTIVSAGAAGVAGVDGDLQVEIAPGVVVTIVDQAVARVLDSQSGTDLGTAASGGVSE